MNHTELDLERTLAYHGAPAMAGIKSADLIAWGSPEACSTPLFRQYQHQLARRGIQLRVIWTGCPRCLLLVYRPERLERQLNDPAVRALLLREGYPAQGGLEAMLETLGRRLNQGDFPHEVGLFLGYPPEDVAGFVRHRGKGCKCVGCWKVYGDEAAARRQFAAFKACTAGGTTSCPAAGRYTPTWSGPASASAGTDCAGPPCAAACGRGRPWPRCSGWRKFICDRRRCGAYRYQLFNPMSYGGYAR